MWRFCLLLVLLVSGCVGPRSAARLPDGRIDADWTLFCTDGFGGKIMFVDVPGGRLYQNLRTGALVFAPGEVGAIIPSEHPGR